MGNVVLRIFSYLPNPRVFKAQIAARLGDVELEVIGDKPAHLANWLWDYDARELAQEERVANNPNARMAQRGFSGVLYKTDRFLATQPFGTVPCAFSPGGEIGVFESNSILRAVARAAQSQLPLYGKDIYTASRIDGFLDANLVFAREAQVYLLNMENLTQEIYSRMQKAYEFYLEGIERALGTSSYLAGDALSIADISFVCDLAQFLREGHYVAQLREQDFELISTSGPQRYPKAFAHMLSLSETPAFTEVLGTYLQWYKNQFDGQQPHQKA